jgi:hypothetical protein
VGELIGEQSEQLIEHLVRKIGRWKLTLPALLVLEVSRPLSFIASQGLLLCQPLLTFFCQEPGVADYADLLAERANVDRLIARLERDRPIRGKHGEERG